MSVQQDIESLRFNGGAANHDSPWSRLRLLRASIALRLVAVRRIAGCIVFGHERWTSIAGEWRCMRCSRNGHRPLPVSTDRGVRRVRDLAVEVRDSRAA